MLHGSKAQVGLLSPLTRWRLMCCRNRQQVWYQISSPYPPEKVLSGRPLSRQADQWVLHLTDTMRRASDCDTPRSQLNLQLAMETSMCLMAGANLDTGGSCLTGWALCRIVAGCLNAVQVQGVPCRQGLQAALKACVQAPAAASKRKNLCCAHSCHNNVCARHRRDSGFAVEA